MSGGKLPEGWATSTINEMCNLNPKLKLDDDLDVGFMPMAGVPTTYLGKCNFETKKWSEVKKGFTQFQNDDVIFAKITPCFENGKAVVIKEFPNGYGAGSTEYYVLRSINGLINPHWLFALVKTKDFLTNGALNMSGSVGHKRVTKEFLENYGVPVPPLAEQKVIAEKLDTLLAQVDSTKARLEQIPQILKRFRQSVIVAAVNGQLTKELHKKNKFKLTELNISIPSLWKISEIGQFADVKGGKRLPKGESLIAENTGFPYIRAGQLKNGTVLPEGQLYLEEYIQKSISRYTVSPGDLYIPIVGSCIGDAGIIPDIYNNANLTENAAKICNLNENIFNRFLSLWLRSSYLQDIINSEIKSGAQGKLALARIKSLPLILPPLQEQHEIVRRVEQLFAYADTIEKQVNNALTRVNSLTQSILAKAFRGELTAQWRAENPELISGENSAAALLEKIKAERAASGGKKTSRKKA